MKVSIVLGSYNRKAFLKSTIKSVRENKISYDYEIIVIDGGSDDGSLEWLLKQKDIITIIQYNRGTFQGKEIKRKSWGYFMNLGFKCAKGEYILMISDDCLILPDSINKGIFHFDDLRNKNRKVGALAFYWRNWPEQKEYMIGLTFNKIFVNHGLYLKSALEEISYIDEEYYVFYHADGDLCLRLYEKGYEVLATENSYIEHYSHANLKVKKSNFLLQNEDWNRYQLRWKKLIPPNSDLILHKIDKIYIDKSKTYTTFPIMERLKIHFNKKVNKYKKILKSPLK
jgi:glycosyltransferase involved in cell wall biosynthesis